MDKRRIVDIGPFLKDLKSELNEYETCCEALTIGEAIEDEICDLEKLPVINLEKMIPIWRDPDKNPPKVEEDVLILFRTPGGGHGITTAHYEDGTVLSEKSNFYWDEIFEWGNYDEKSDDYFIPKGWWEYRYFNLDEVYNNRVDDPVVGWMPLPPKEVAR